MEQMIGVSQVAEILGVKEHTIRQWVHQKKLPFYKIGRLVKFRESDIEEWIKARNTEPGRN